MWTKEELLKSLDEEVTIEKLKDFIPKLLSRLYVEGLSYGNLSSHGNGSLLYGILRMFSNQVEFK